MYVTKQDDHQTELIELNVTFVRSLCVCGGGGGFCGVEADSLCL